MLAPQPDALLADASNPVANNDITKFDALIDGPIHAFLLETSGTSGEDLHLVGLTLDSRVGRLSTKSDALKDGTETQYGKLRRAIDIMTQLRGSAAQPDEASWSRAKEEIHEIVCSSENSSYNKTPPTSDGVSTISQRDIATILSQALNGGGYRASMTRAPGSLAKQQ